MTLLKQYFFSTRHLPLKAGSILLALLVASIGVQQLRSLYSAFANVDLQLTVKPQALGVYAIAGTTNLPDHTRIVVSAVRYLSSADPHSQQLNPKPTYSILAYQSAQVMGGKWQTELNLWQVAPDGQYVEVWQTEQAKLNLALTPSEDIVFLAALNPVSAIDQLPVLEQQLRDKKLRLSGKLVYTTAEGQQYVQVQHMQTVALPDETTNPVAIDPEQINGGWGARYLMPGEPQNPYQLEKPKDRQTNAPMRREEFLQ